MGFFIKIGWLFNRYGRKIKKSYCDSAKFNRVVMSECTIAVVPVCIRTYNSIKLSGIIPLGLISPSPQRRK